MWRFVSRLCGVSLRWPSRCSDDFWGGNVVPGAVSEPCVSPHCSPGARVPNSASKHKFTICVEGNIGSGKSTLLNYLAKFREVEMVAEQLDKWRSIRGNNLLEMMYRDPCRWSYLFQSYVQLTMAQSHAVSTTSPVKLMERSIHSACFCFVENMYLNGKMSEAEYSVYWKWYKALTDSFDCRVDLIVYLRTDPKLVHARAKNRARVEEQEIPLEYFIDLHKLYEEWMSEEKFPLAAPVIILDANDDLSTMYRKYNLITQEIMDNKSFLTSLVQPKISY